MLTRLKEQGFFEKREAILEKAKNLEFINLWVMLPSISRLSPLDPETLHLMYLLEPGSYSYMKQKNMLCDALLDDFDITVMVQLHSKKGLEDWIVISPENETLYRARLHHVIPMEKLLPDTPLTEQPIYPLTPPSLEELKKRVFGEAEESKEEINSNQFVASNNTSTLANIASADNTTVDHSPIREEELVEPPYKMSKISHEETTPPQKQRPVIISNGTKFFHKKTKGDDLLKFNRKNNTRKLP